MIFDFSGRRYQKFSAALFFTLAAVWLVVHLWLGRAPGTDEVFFKGPGLSWAKGGPWAALEEPDFFPKSVQPGIHEVFFSYPPAYPFGFGLWVKLFGFSWRTCIAYDALIHLALIGALGWFFSRATDFTARHKWLLLSGLLFAGTSSRPDELAMTFGYLGITLALRHDAHSNSNIRLWSSHLLMALCGITSVPCVMALGAMRAAWIFFSPLSLRRRAYELGGLAITVAAVWIAAAAWVMSWHPGALQQNLAASVGNVTSEAQLGIAHLLAYHREAFAVGMALVLAGVIQLMLVRHWPALISWCQWWLAPLLIWLFFFCRYRFQGGYYWFWTPWMLAAVMAVAPHLRFTRRFSPEPLALAICLSLTAILGVQSLRHVVITVCLPADQRWTVEAPVVNSIIPNNARVLTWAHWWTLGDRCRVIDNFVAENVSPSQFDYLVMTAHGSGKPGTHHALPPSFQEAIARGRFQIIHNTIDSAPAQLGSLRLSNSAWGAGSIIYAATGEPEAASGASSHKKDQEDPVPTQQ